MTTATESDRRLDRAAEVIRDGGLVIVATETFYAIATDPFNEDSLKRVFRVKGRESDKPPALIAATRAVVPPMVRRPDERLQALMDRFWPGSVTILFDPAVQVPLLLTGRGGKIGIRVPPMCPARRVASLGGGFITATSANLSGGPDPDTVRAIPGDVLDAVDMVLDTGPTGGRRPSTVVDPVGYDLNILREGAVPGAVLRNFYLRCLKREEKLFEYNWN
ncbi:MAG: L-threonylcarbamoyladenylate synthase [Pseudomonadota bacterium]